jgi:hypothetical protein
MNGLVAAVFTDIVLAMLVYPKYTYSKLLLEKDQINFPHGLIFRNPIQIPSRKLKNSQCRLHCPNITSVQRMVSNKFVYLVYNRRYQIKISIEISANKNLMFGMFIHPQQYGVQNVITHPISIGDTHAQQIHVNKEQITTSVTTQRSTAQVISVQCFNLYITNVILPTSGWPRNTPVTNLIDSPQCDSFITSINCRPVILTQLDQYLICQKLGESAYFAPPFPIPPIPFPGLPSLLRTPYPCDGLHGLPQKSL